MQLHTTRASRQCGTRALYNVHVHIQYTSLTKNKCFSPTHFPAVLAGLCAHTARNRVVELLRRHTKIRLIFWLIWTVRYVQYHVVDRIYVGTGYMIAIIAASSIKSSAACFGLNILWCPKWRSKVRYFLARPFWYEKG